MANVSGHWKAVQSNGAVVDFNLQQAGATVIGSALSGGAAGTVSGTCNGRSLLVEVDWTSGSRGEYTGTIADNGRASGQTFDLAHPESQALWFSEAKFPL